MTARPAEEREADEPEKGAGAATPRVLVFFDYACPLCYIDEPRFEELERDYDVELVHVPFELRPDIPEGGISAKEHGLGHSEKVEEHMARLAREGGFEMHIPDLLPRTHRALVMGEVARDQGIHRPVHRAIFSAYFADERDLGDETVLLDVAAAAGLDPADVRRAWESGSHEDRLHSFRHLATSLGVDATPSALICNQLIIGSRPYGVIRDALERCLVTEENLEEVAG